MKHLLMTFLACFAPLTSCVQDPKPVAKAATCNNTPTLAKNRLVAEDCAILPGRYWPAKNPKGGVILLHNFGDYHKAFLKVGPAFRAAGYSAFAFDQRGFGDTGERGRWYGEDKLVSDAANAAELLRQEVSGRPIYVLGESMGGSVAMVLAANGMSVDGLILAAPGVREGIDYRWFWDAALWVGDTVAPSADVENTRGENAKLTQAATDRLSTSPKIVRDVRVDTYSGLVDLADSASQAAYKISVPTLLLYGGDDGTIDPAAIANAEQALGNVTAKRYPSAPHLLLQSVYSEGIVEDTLNWLSDQQ